LASSFRFATSRFWRFYRDGVLIGLVTGLRQEEVPERFRELVSRSTGAMLELIAMLKANTTSEIDWSECELVERVPGKVSGRPATWANQSKNFARDSHTPA
jgi:hypothetical protein